MHIIDARHGHATTKIDSPRTVECCHFLAVAHSDVATVLDGNGFYPFALTCYCINLAIGQNQVNFRSRRPIRTGGNQARTQNNNEYLFHEFQSPGPKKKKNINQTMGQGDRRTEIQVALTH